MSIARQPQRNDRKASVWQLFWRQRHLQFFALVGVVYLIIFNYIPMVGILMAFKKYKISSGFIGIFTSPWVGFKYFNEFMTDYNFGHIMKNTIVMSLLKMVFTFPLPILLALVLNEVKNKPFKKLVQTTSYLPYFISWVIVTGFCQLFLQSNGLVNELLMAMGKTSSPIPFLTSLNAFLPIAIITSCWKDMGWWAILFLASITGIDPTLYEAAEIDGANMFQQFIHITLPEIKDVILLSTLMSTIWTLNEFETIWLMTGGGPNGATQVMNVYSYRTAMRSMMLGRGIAVSVLAMPILILLISALTRKMVVDDRPRKRKGGRHESEENK